MVGAGFLEYIFVFGFCIFLFVFVYLYIHIVTFCVLVSLLRMSGGGGVPAAVPICQASQAPPYTNPDIYVLIFS